MTSFFLDTAKNVVAYIEVIQKILKPGGVWINMGPLLYHFEELEDEISIELSYEEVREVILRSGFEMGVGFSSSSSCPFPLLSQSKRPSFLAK